MARCQKSKVSLARLNKSLKTRPKKEENEVVDRKARQKSSQYKEKNPGYRA